MSTISGCPRRRLQSVLLAAGPVVLVVAIIAIVAIVAIVIDRVFVVVRREVSALPTLPETAYSGYAYQPPVDPNAVADSLLTVLLVVAAVGAIAVVAAVSVRFAGRRG